MKTYYCDAVVIGGGICGVWVHSLLKQKGYSCLLLEKDKIGGEQSLLSQGILHRGMKYLLGGVFSDISDSLTKATKFWQQALAGVGALDLSDTEILAKQQLLWCQDNLLSNFITTTTKNFFKSQTKTLEQELAWLPNKKTAFWLQETILNGYSLFENFYKQQQQDYYQLTVSSSNCQIVEQQNTICLQFKIPQIKIVTKKIILAAGAGNIDLAQFLGIQQEIQLRPLRMFLVEHSLPLKIYGHCLINSSKPLFTISSHETNSNKMIWYLGGKIAEDGCKLNVVEAIQKAKKIIQQNIKVKLKNDNWKIVDINRAEPQQKKISLPNQVFVKKFQKTILCLPIKLTLTPIVAEKVLEFFKLEKIIPQFDEVKINELKTAELKKPFWETAFS